MRTPTAAGQYRRVRYSDDGCDIYSCCWCDRTIEIRDNPEWSGWNFCPKCGKSWFKQLKCRPTTTPRWFWDRWGDDLRAEKVTLGSGEVVAAYETTDRCYKRRKPTHEWFFEVRSKWGLGAEWGKWEFEKCSDHDKMGCWKWALQVVRSLRAYNEPRDEDDFYFEYRVTLRKKNGH